MSNPTTPFSWQMPTSTDLVTDLPADFEVFGQAVATSMADLLGGTTGQILSKTSNTDMDFTWIANDQGDITGVTATSPLTGGGTSGAITVGIQDASTTQKGSVQLSDSTSTTSSILASTPTAVKSAYDLASTANTTAGNAIAKSTVTTAGDIIYRNATVPTRLGIGTAGQVLTVNSGATAPEWTTFGSSGMTLITSVNYSGAASFSVDSVFSATYDYYRIICTNTSGSGSAAQININFRTGGVTNTAASYNYGGQARLYSSATSDFSNGAAGANAFIWRTNGGVWSGNLDVYNPFAAQRTWFSGVKTDTYEAGTVGGFFDNTTSFDGFLITNTGSTNIAGTVKIYGYKN